MEIFRRALPSDALELDGLNAEFNEPGCTTPEAIAKSIRENGREIVCVAESGGKLVGFCCGQMIRSMCYDDVSGEITELYVMETHRRKGIASGLMRLIESEFQKRGINDLHLLTGDDNDSAQAFYVRQGYEKDTEILFRKSMKEEK